MRFSFVLPAYKATFLSQAIDSIVTQSYDDWELIVIDDHSPENIKGIVETYNDSRIKYFRNEKNIGGKNLVTQWNHSISFAQGEFIVLASDDDLYEPSFCVEISTLIDKYPEVDIVRSRVLQIDEQGKPLWDDGITKEYSSKYEYLHDWLEGTIFTCIGNFAFRRSALESAGGFIDFPCAFGSDIATPIMLSVNGVASTSEMLFNFRQSTLNLSNNCSKYKEKLEAISLLSEWLSKIEYEAPTAEDDIKAYSIKTDQYLHAKCVYDYFNLVIKYLPANKLVDYLKLCTLASGKDKAMMLLRWVKHKLFQ